MSDFSDLEPGRVFDQRDLDAKLPLLRMHSSPVFTGRDMEEIERHFGKGVGDLNLPEMQTASAYVYLRRAGVEATWEMAGSVAVEVPRTVDPTDAGPSDS